MATYVELHDLLGSPTLDTVRKRIRVAIAVRAQTIAADQAATAGQKAWAKEALKNVTGHEEAVLRYILAANKAATVAAIIAADDAAVQTQVDAAVNTMLAA